MKHILTTTLCASGLLLSGCGGGGGDATPAADTQAPALTSASASAPSGGTVTLTASATDNTQVTGYCFKTIPVMPVAADTCFQAAAAQQVTLTTPNPVYYVWAKDAASNISAHQTIAIDTQAPALASATASAPSGGSVTLTASATDNTQVTGYCFKTTQATPGAADACFQTAASKPVALAVPNVAYYVWAKDATGNISAPLNVRGPCSAGGYAASDASANPTVCVSTSLGELVLALEPAKAPITTANFLKYANDGFYAGTVFHRVISNFMVQGGGFTSDLQQKTPTYAAIALETPATTGLSNTTGTIAMARTSVLNSATSQFFINVVDNKALDTAGGGYAAFGHVISGMDTTVQAIRGVAVKSNGSEVSLPTTLPVVAWAYQLK